MEDVLLLVAGCRFVRAFLDVSAPLPPGHRETILFLVAGDTRPQDDVNVIQ